MKKFDPKTSDTPLPEGITRKDLEYPKVKRDKKFRVLNPAEELVRDAGEYGQLTFYETAGFGWCLATLGIARARSPGKTDRTYAVRVSDGGSVRIGAGPHVTRTIKVYVRRGRLTALKKYVEMFQSGQVQANSIRDRISSRRAEGALMRAQGRSYWRWTV